jgi:hypothetical protein
MRTPGPRAQLNDGLIGASSAGTAALADTRPAGSGPSTRCSGEAAPAAVSTAAMGVQRNLLRRPRSRAGEG